MLAAILYYIICFDYFFCIDYIRDHITKTKMYRLLCFFIIFWIQMRINCLNYHIFLVSLKSLLAAILYYIICFSFFFCIDYMRDHITKTKMYRLLCFFIIFWIQMRINCLNYHILPIICAVSFI